MTSTLVYTYNASGLRVAQSVDGDVTTFAWDWASAVPEMLSEGQAMAQAMGSSIALYLVGHETLGRWDGAAWAYYLPDALGSIRQETDGTGAVTDSREWTPFGLGYAGEWLNIYTNHSGMLYLRARWYQAHTGRFSSPDLIIPDLRRPQSVNRYAYALGNPVRFSDRTGLFPTEDQICDDDDTEYRCSEFTCNCGWIDWTHLRTSDRLGYDLLDDLAYAVDSYWPEPTLRDSWGIYVGIPLGFAGVEMDLFGGYAVIPHRQVPTGSEDRTTLATSIFMDANERFEELQGAHSWLPFVGGKLKSSYYSEEDLPSDIIGFYAGYQRFISGLGYEQVYQQVRELCISVGKQASVNVFRETYKNGTLAQTNWRNWHPRFIPLAGCNSHVCKGTRTWPSNFAVLTPARIYPGVNGPWWWFRNMSEDGSLVSTERPRVYRLLKDLRVPTPPPYAP